MIAVAIIFVVVGVALLILAALVAYLRHDAHDRAIVEHQGATEDYADSLRARVRASDEIAIELEHCADRLDDGIDDTDTPAEYLRYRADLYRRAGNETART